MRMFEQISSLRSYVRGMRNDERQKGKTIGFVPTMGALHEGHLGLIRKAKSDCDIVIGSVFVNPTQFGPNEDLAAYPRTLARDQQLASQEGLDAMFVPVAAEIYPAGYQTTVTVPIVSAGLEGAIRPGHFAGVATVVLKLLNIVQPDRLYLGQKDFQQAVVVDRMIHDLNVPAELIVVPTVRAADGLALSSRNVYLSPEERRAATILFRTLQTARESVAAGEDSAEQVLLKMHTTLASEPLARPDYVLLVDPSTLEPVTAVGEAASIALLAVRIGKTRLIDNGLLLPPNYTMPRSRFFI